MATNATGYQPRTESDHLPRRPAGPERHVGRGLLALLGVLLLVVGVPVALVVLVGNPLPTSAPSRDWLTADITVSAIIKVLAVLLWVVWAHFVVCLLTEWRAIRAGRVPDAVPWGGGSQLVARRLVAALLLLGGAATIAQGAASASQGTGATPSVSPTAAVSVTPLHAGSGPVISPQQAKAVEAERVAATAQEPESTKYYEVKPPHGRHHDTLWDIADRTLGDPFRYKEIFELNKGRVQADGRRLVEADLIHPGWQLVMPADARGPGIRTVEGSAPAATHSTVAPPTHGAGAALAQRAGGSHLTVQQDGAVEHAVSDTDGVPGGLLGGGMVLAGLLVALTARRGAYGTPDEDENALRLAANTHRAAFLDTALRVLAESRAAAGQAMPDLSAVYANDEQVVVHVVGANPAPESPWRASDDGASWSVHADELEGRTSSAPAPYPALVNIARSHGYDLLVDLEYAPGIVSIGGNDQLARETVLSCVVDLATHAWSDGVDVCMVGFGDDTAALPSSEIRVAQDLDVALGEVEASVRAADGLLRRLGADGVLTGRLRGRHGELKPRVLVLSGAPTPAQLQRIAALQATSRSTLTVLVVGDVLGARWRFVVDETGSIDLGVLGVNGTARRYTRELHARIGALLQRAAAEARDRTREVATAAPLGVAHDLGLDLPDPTGAPSASAPVDAPVRVRLLGRVEVHAPGPAHGQHHGLLTEVVTMAALHPGGLHESVLAAALWPRGVEEHVVDEVLSHAQSWVGTDATGRARLHLGDDGLWHLGPDVHVDWYDLQARVARAGEDAEALAAALDLVDGELFSGTAAGRYTWLAFHRSARDARALVTAAARSAGWARAERGDLAGAVAALRAGLAGVPTAQVLWRALLKLTGDTDPAAVSGVVGELVEAVPGQLEGETEALIAHLLPGYRSGTGS